jgi:hypothetical protein
MMIEFDRTNWLNNLKREIGLSHVPYDELHLHSISFDLFNTDDSLKRNAKEYIDEQLEIIEEQYKSVGANINELDDLLVACNEDTVVTPTGEFFGNVEPTLIQLPEIKQTIERANMHYYDVDVNGNHYTVVINDHGGDCRIKDQIAHVVNTSYFIEERDPNSLTQFDNIISYYQFANVIQRIVAENVDVTAYQKIVDNIDTVFDGLNFDDVKL